MTSVTWTILVESNGRLVSASGETPKAALVNLAAQLQEFGAPKRELLDLLVELRDTQTR
jgi:hypothetical protein